ncbi:hypothetical protein STEG23_003956 [Scotinomys teguina]
MRETEYRDGTEAQTTFMSAFRDKQSDHRIPPSLMDRSCLELNSRYGSTGPCLLFPDFWYFPCAPVVLSSA